MIYPLIRWLSKPGMRQATSSATVRNTSLTLYIRDQTSGNGPAAEVTRSASERLRRRNTIKPPILRWWAPLQPPPSTPLATLLYPTSCFASWPAFSASAWSSASPSLPVSQVTGPLRPLMNVCFVARLPQGPRVAAAGCSQREIDPIRMPHLFSRGADMKY